MHLLDKQVVVRLNKSWVPYALATLRDAITFLCSEAHGTKPGLAIDFETSLDSDGKPVLTYANPISWDEWIKLPVRENDLFINTSRGPIRAPLVVICAHFDRIPTKNIRWSTGNVHRRDNYTCAYTGEKLSHSLATVDHIIPRSRGGRDSWTNTVTCHRRINVMKADKTPEEAGLTLRIKPTAPLARPSILTKDQAPHPSVIPFLV